MKKTHVQCLCLPLACLVALSACAPGGADAEPRPIEVPPPVEQTNEGLTIFYTDAIPLQATILDMAVRGCGRRRRKPAQHLPLGMNLQGVPL